MNSWARTTALLTEISIPGRVRCMFSLLLLSEVHNPVVFMYLIWCWHISLRGIIQILNEGTTKYWPIRLGLMWRQPFWFVPNQVSYTCVWHHFYLPWATAALKVITMPQTKGQHFVFPDFWVMDFCYCRITKSIVKLPHFVSTPGQK